MFQVFFVPIQLRLFSTDSQKTLFFEFRQEQTKKFDHPPANQLRAETRKFCFVFCSCRVLPLARNAGSCLLFAFCMGKPAFAHGFATALAFVVRSTPHCVRSMWRSSRSICSLLALIVLLFPEAFLHGCSCVSVSLCMRQLAACERCSSAFAFLLYSTQFLQQSFLHSGFCFLKS